jgi:hypothetical protein
MRIVTLEVKFENGATRPRWHQAITSQFSQGIVKWPDGWTPRRFLAEPFSRRKWDYALRAGFDFS